MRTLASLVLVICLGWTSPVAAAFVMNNPVSFSDANALCSFGLGAGSVVPRSNAVYAQVHSTIAQHLQLGYQYGVDYTQGRLPALAQITGLSVGYGQMFGTFGFYAGTHSEQASPGSQVAYAFANNSYNLYGVMQLGAEDNEADEPVVDGDASGNVFVLSLPKDTVMYMGFRRTNFDSYRFPYTGDNSLFQFIAGTHANGGDVAMGLGNFYAEIALEMSEFGFGSADHLFAMNMGMSFDLFGPSKTDKAKILKPDAFKGVPSV